jgi:hypothetical protein
MRQLAQAFLRAKAFAKTAALAALESRPRASARELLAACATAAVGLSTVYVYVNPNVGEPGAIASLTFGTLACVMGVEATHHTSARKTCISLVLGTAVLLFVSLEMALRSHSTPLIAAAGPASPLRMDFVPTAPPDSSFAVVFARDRGEGLPVGRWSPLHALGGIDGGGSNFSLLIANRSNRELVVTDIGAQVVGTQPSPCGSVYTMYTQGEEPVPAWPYHLRAGQPDDCFLHTKSKIDQIGISTCPRHPTSDPTRSH